MEGRGICGIVWESSAVFGTEEVVCREWEGWGSSRSTNQVVGRWRGMGEGTNWKRVEVTLLVAGNAKVVEDWDGVSL